jgi:drug/metabolite transporter (DMT)-like permease
MQAAGVLAAILSSALGGTAIVATRFLATGFDPITLGAVRFVGGAMLLLPLAQLAGSSWPRRRDWPGTLALGLLFFALFPFLFNAALRFTTAARGALALSSLPVLTMLAAAILRVERLSSRKTLGVILAMAGVAMALGLDLATAPVGAWRGDLLMLAAAVCMALYNVLSRPLIARSSATAFAACGMAVGGACLIVLAAAAGGAATLAAATPMQWLALAYLAVVCGAFVFFLWAFALSRTTPTLVAISVAVNPLTASVCAALLLAEPIGGGLVAGFVAVTLGILIATGALARHS